MSDATIQRAIAELVPKGSRVLDLGCGDGAMLDYLQRERDCTGYGIEIADANVLACIARGVNVIQLNLDEGLAIFEDESFDVVLQIDTLQHLRNAEVMLRETAACLSPSACPTSGTTRPISASAPMPIWPTWQRATACACSTALACRRAASCALRRIGLPGRRCISWRGKASGNSH